MVAQTIGERSSAEQRRAWADLRDSSAEDLECSPVPPAPLLHADSYIETPEPSFDEWSGSAVCNLTAHTRLINEEVVDVPRPSSGPDTIPKPFEGQAEQQPTTWQPNAAAPVFIPMAQQLLVDGAAADVEEESTSPARTRIRQKRRVQTPTNRGGQTGNKRLRQEEDVATNGTTSAASSSRPEALEACIAGDVSMADGATEEDWARRHEKRHNVVQSIKSTTEYEVMAQQRREGRLGPAAPVTPNPNDRSVSKRKWEAEVMHWRNALRQFTRAQTTPSPDRASIILPTLE